MTNTKVLNLAETLTCKLEQTARIMRISGMRFFEQNNFGLSFSEFVILDQIYNNKDVHQRDLAKHLQKGTANLSRELDELEKRNLINRIIDTKGKRIVKKLSLTEKGIEIYSNVGKYTVEQILSIEKIYTESELKIFKSFLTRLNDKLTDSGHIMIFE